MVINQNERKAIYSENCSMVFSTVAKISFPDWGNGVATVLKLIDNNQDVGEYTACGFDFTPPSPNAPDETASLSVDDVDRRLTELFQSIPSSADPVRVSVGMINVDEPGVLIDGPYEYRVSGFSKSSTDGKANISLQRLAMLNSNVSSERYTADNFPGLYG